ncbi:putative chitin binding protein [Mycena indigotica]|uniref:Putative chitin binding protein n=1 Tax=Mycena indigotica TaxID=2126181 RepID=A0A8H6SY56_9AGAR|nr:putative chitin binding protein [Mycena indigotica]KAF7306922.1 putative chitin binding protein [Mycena indigotica]
MVSLLALVPLLALAQLPGVLGHALVTSPAIRAPGPAFQEACGTTSFNAVTNIPDGHIEEQEPVTPGCELTLCRGMLFEDQPSTNVLKVKPLQKMQMAVDCTIPHGGPANVSLVDTTVGGAGEIVGSFLKTFDDFCPTTGAIPADQSTLQYTLPDAATIGTKCRRPGECVVQLFWATPGLDQNYYYCVDVVMAAAKRASATKKITAATKKATATKKVVASKKATLAAPTITRAVLAPTLKAPAVAKKLTSVRVAAKPVQTPPAVVVEAPVVDVEEPVVDVEEPAVDVEETTVEPVVDVEETTVDEAALERRYANAGVRETVLNGWIVLSLILGFVLY